MTYKEIEEQIFLKKSYLCVGLDSNINKIPSHLRNDPSSILSFNKKIIDSTKDLCVSYKINTAFYEVLGSEGWDIIEETVNYIPKTHFKIADAKRGDIGNTSTQYARAFFERLNFDAVTVAPYMGEDSIRPFLEFKNKWTIVLGLTSNKGSEDFQQQKLENEYLYESVLKKVSNWGTPENLMFVAGATKPQELITIRKIIPDNFLLVPGVGFQGGSLNEVSKYGMNKSCGLLVNVSRAIIYASEKEDFEKESRAIALQYQVEMEQLLSSGITSHLSTN